MILHMPVHMGGLGLHSVKFKALASLLRTFMETAAHPSYHHNLFHTILYRVNVLGDDTIPSPPLPPYYPDLFFQTIRNVKENTPLNVTTMTTADWYRVLVEQEVTMVELPNSPREYIRSRAELASVNTDWDTSWKRARMKGLGSEATSFLWKLLHRLLPCEERLSRMLPNTSSNCKLCPVQVNADLPHCLLQCISTSEIGNMMLSMVRLHDPAVTMNKLLRLEFQCEESVEMSLV